MNYKQTELEPLTKDIMESLKYGLLQIEHIPDIHREVINVLKYAQTLTQARYINAVRKNDLTWAAKENQILLMYQELGIL